MSKICFTAIFGQYEELKEPRHVTDDWQYYCFTDQPITSNTWRIIPTNVADLWHPNIGIPKDKWNAKYASRYMKINNPYLHTWDQSFWVDASFRIDVDLNEWWRINAKGSFSVPAHPLRDDWWTEAWACIDSKRCDKPTLQAQMEAYKHIPRHAGVIQSGLLMRTPESQPLNEAWWDELCKWSTRDQLAFCNLIGHEFHTYKFNYRGEKDFVYSKHFKNR